MSDDWPGDTAERHADAVRAVVEAGHEIGHHGYLHLRSDEGGDAAQREEIERGHRAALLERLIAEMRTRANVWFAPHGDVERWLVR